MGKSLKMVIIKQQILCALHLQDLRANSIKKRNPAHIKEQGFADDFIVLGFVFGRELKYKKPKPLLEFHCLFFLIFVY